MEFLKCCRTPLTKPQKLTLYFLQTQHQLSWWTTGSILSLSSLFCNLSNISKLIPQPTPPHDHKDKVWWVWFKMHQQAPISYTASYSLHSSLYNLVSTKRLIMSPASQTGRVELLLRWVWPNVYIRHHLAIVHSWSAIICNCTASCNFALLRHPSHARLHLSPKSQPSRLDVHCTIISLA